MSRKNPEEKKLDPGAWYTPSSLPLLHQTLKHFLQPKGLAEYLVVISSPLIHVLKLFNAAGIRDCYTTYRK